MMEVNEIKPWFFQVEPYDGESISHFLGRFRRANNLSPSGLGRAAGLGGTIARWEKFRFNPRPTLEQVKNLSAVVGVSPERLMVMLPSENIGMKMEPIRVCAVCYSESPCHRIEWQFKETQGCNRHQVRLLSECPNCGLRFKSPALWSEGNCQRCYLPVTEMVPYLKPLQPASIRNCDMN